MRCYLVGGAVRDQLLGLPVTEKDWVVVGATPEMLVAQGYVPVGKDFPVFLHPETKEEYALARTERKTGRGYQGFTWYADPHVTLHQDLMRRDLTVNAMAQDEHGTVIDPYGGQQDLKSRVLRHVSSAFIEDPVRMLRVARFSARFEDFHIHEETQALMQSMVHSGEVDALVPERVWQEMKRALMQPAPGRFFEVLADCGALSVVVPGLQLSQLNLPALQHAANKNFPEMMRFAALMSHLPCADIKKYGHHLRVPKATLAMAVLVARHVSACASFQALTPEMQLRFFEQTDAFRRPERFAQFLAVCAVTQTEKISSQLLRAYYVASAVTAQPLMDAGLNDAALAKGLREQRCLALERLIGQEGVVQ